MSKKLKDSIVVGFALFAVFFGAGNLIFPSFIGVSVGSKWAPALVGLVLSGILLPIMTVLSVDNMGGQFEKLCRPVTSWFFGAYTVVFIIFTVTCGISRQGGIGIESGLFSVVPVLQGNRASLIAALFCYFVLVYFFVTNKTSIIDIVGRYLTPFILIVLVFIIIMSIVKPIGTPIDTGAAGTFTFGFLQGYQTGDVMVGVVIAATFIDAVVKRGYVKKSERTSVVLGAAVIAFLGLLIIYGGLLYLGATGSSLFDSSMDQTALLNALVETCIGRIGTSLLGVGVLLACLTTTIGVIASISNLTELVTKGKISFKTALIAYCILGFAIAAIGVANIIKYTYPTFMLMYPIAIVLTLLGCFKKFVPNHGAWKGSILMAALIGAYEAVVSANSLGAININLSALANVYNKLPLVSYGFAWLLPCVIGFIAGAVIVKVKGGEAYPMIVADDAADVM